MKPDRWQALLGAVSGNGARGSGGSRRTPLTVSVMLASAASAAVLLGACGGGGDGGAGTAAAAGSIDPPPANGSYAGTYACTSTDGAVVLTAVLPTASGAFSTCGGTGASGAVTIVCTGTIATDGTLAMAGRDSHGNSVTFTGAATGQFATGTFAVRPAGVSGDFQCLH